jgi:hypothetical protein
MKKSTDGITYSTTSRLDSAYLNYNKTEPKQNRILKAELINSNDPKAK